jgi:hypothetical protein
LENILLIYKVYEVNQQDDTRRNGQLDKKIARKGHPANLPKVSIRTFWPFYVQVDLLASSLLGGWPFLLLTNKITYE